jgi:hypothetical protein
MKTKLIFIVLFLNLFCKLASAQWNDDALLLREPNLESIVLKKKRIRPQTSVGLQREKNPFVVQEELRKPNQVVSDSEILVKNNSEVVQNNIDTWIGIRKTDQVSKFANKNFIGETPTIGVKANFLSMDWSWFFLYDTGFYYQISKKPELRLRDENLQVGFLKKNTDSSLDFSYGVSLFENKIVNENLNTGFVGHEKLGVSLLLQKNYNVDESMVLVYGLNISPLIAYKETSIQRKINSGKLSSIMTNALEFGLVEKVDAHNSILINASYTWAEVQFKGATSVVDSVKNETIQNVKIREENYNIQVGYRWGL